MVRVVTTKARLWSSVSESREVVRRKGRVRMRGVGNCPSVTNIAERARKAEIRVDIEDYGQPHPTSHASPYQPSNTCFTALCNGRHGSIRQRRFWILRYHLTPMAHSPSVHLFFTLRNVTCSVSASSLFHVIGTFTGLSTIPDGRLSLLFLFLPSFSSFTMLNRQSPDSQVVSEVYNTTPHMNEQQLRR